MQDEADNPLIMRNSRSYGANLDKESYNMELLKKIPEDAEVASVLVGTSVSTNSLIRAVLVPVPIM